MELAIARMPPNFDGGRIERSIIAVKRRDTCLFCEESWANRSFEVASISLSWAYEYLDSSIKVIPLRVKTCLT